MTGLLRALHFPELEAFERHRHPGSFHLVAGDHPGLWWLWHFCPCGCGRSGALRVGEGARPGGTERAWRWNGSRTEPTLDPAVTLSCGWRGRLSSGYWRTA